MYAQYGIESLGLKKKTEKKHKKKLLPKTEIWCLVKRCPHEKNPFPWLKVVDEAIFPTNRGYLGFGLGFSFQAAEVPEPLFPVPETNI